MNALRALRALRTASYFAVWLAGTVLILPFHAQDDYGSEASTTRKPIMKSLMKGLAPSNQRLAERQSNSEASHAPPRMTFQPIGFVGGPCGSVTAPPGKLPYQS